MKPIFFLLLSASCLTACDGGSSSTTTTSAPPPATAPNNTAVNTRDKPADSITAGAQGQNKNDVQTTADIRKRVMDAKLSVDAQNCKIVTQNGKVTLRGPVKTQDEKDTIAKLATDVAGTGNVDNQLEVLPSP